MLTPEVSPARAATHRPRMPGAMRWGAWALLAQVIVLAAPVAARAVCGGGGTSTLAPPAVTFLRSYRAGFGAPTRVAVDAAGNAYVTDAARGQVVVRAANGRIVSKATGLGHPISVAVGSAGRVYIGDGAAGSVTAFAADWSPLFQLGQGPGEFLLPNDLGVDATTGNVYVADSKAHVVKIYSAAGAFLQSFGGQGSGDGQFNFPVALFVDPTAQQVLVVDQLNYRVEVFDTAGNFLSCFGTQGSGPGKFNMPQGVTVDAQGRVFVADAFEGRVQVLDRNGDFVRYIGDFGDGAGQLRIPVGLAIDRTNRLLVGAANNARLEMFGLDAFTDREAVTPATITIEPNPIERATPASVVAAYIEIPGSPLDQVAVGSISANGVAAGASSAIGDHDGNGVPDLRVEFDRAALLATLPTEGSGDVAVSGSVGALQFEASGSVQLTLCGPATVCSLDAADPRCNTAVCVAGVGCTVQPKAAGTGCEDGNACTIEDTCSGGICVGTPLSCDDGNGCTDDTCDPTAGCVHTSNTAPCDDGSVCTTDDVCADGSCTGTPRDCDDGNVCTDDACDPLTGCVHLANTAPCDDGSVCTAGDACVAGLCRGVAISCDDANPCTADTCDPVTGCAHASTPSACDDGNVCTADSCDPNSGCRHTATAAACDDGDPGTVHDICTGSGLCKGQTTIGHYAVLSWPPESRGHRSVFLAEQVRARGTVCAENIRVGSSDQIAADAVGWATDEQAVTLGRGSQVAGSVVSGGGALKGLEQATVGGRVDRTGSAPELADCVAAGYRANQQRVAFGALAPTAGFALGTLRVDRGMTQRLPSARPFGAGQIVIDATTLQLGPSSTLTLVGTPATDAVVVHIRGRLLVGQSARITTDGVPPERVILVVDGPVSLQPGASVSATVFAADQVDLGRGSSIVGALLGGSIYVGPDSVVDLHPFAAW